MSHIVAEYLVETPLDPLRVADVMAGEQSSGTFVRVHGETDELRERTRAIVEAVDEIGVVQSPSLPNAFLERRGIGGPYHQARIRIRFPEGNIGANLATLAATVAGNLYDLGEVTGLRLDRLTLSPAYRRAYCLPAHGINGTRTLMGVAHGPLIGSIIKPNVGLTPEQTADLVGDLCRAGLNFIKDDEISTNPATAPLHDRIKAVMAKVRAYRDETGRNVMVAFNISDETDAMRRHADLIAEEGGHCAMVSLNWCGYSAVETLRRHCDLVLHGHRNGFGAFSRHPMLGISFQAYQVLWRLAGVDHMHVHGLQGKFAQEDAEVVQSARDCLTRLDDASDDRVLPAFSSGQWAGTVPATWAAMRTSNLLFMSGGGIMAHPMGPQAGVTSIRQAFAAVAANRTLEAASAEAPELAAALGFFGKG